MVKGIKVMRINNISSKRNYFDLSSNSPNVFVKELQWGEHFRNVLFQVRREFPVDF